MPGFEGAQNGDSGQGGPLRVEIAHFQSMVAAVQDYAIFMLDTEGRVTTWNTGAEKIKGYRAKEILGQHFSCFYTPEARERHWPDQALKIAAGQGQFGDEGWRVRNDGSRFWASILITAIRDPDGRLRGFLKITRDLSDRRRHEELLRQSEERFRLLVNAVQDYAIFMIDPNGKVASWNPGAERINGYTAVEIMGQDFSCFYTLEARTEGKPAQDLQAAAKQGSVEDHGWRVRKDGSRFWAVGTLTAVYDSSSQLRGFAKITRDMTERKQIEALEEARERIHEFLAMLSHELRNPLAPLQASADILASRALSDAIATQASDVIGRQVQHLTHLVDELLDMSRITSGRITLSRELLDISLVVTRAIEASRPLIDAKSHVLAVALPSSPVLVSGDLTRLTQVFVNLLNNAARYTPAGGQIEVFTRICEAGVAVHVRDNGVGMTPELLPRVFELFTQGPRALDRSEGGLGIGLALVQQLVRLHGGTIEASSSGPELGSEFIVRLPIDAGDSAVQAPVLNSESGAKKAHMQQIMVVDDNRDAADSIAMLLKLWGHEAVCVYSGAEALRVAKQHPPDVVLLDIGLPGMDGYEVATRLRQMPEASRATLVAITGYSQEEDRQRTQRAGFDHHLVKPVAPDTLQSLLQSLDKG
ncbi:MAG TPA: PAS domain S-box protein [Steroidobacteraceae bacterium]|nr:PAS domain S-box protein [Steroidobacteraceae bacterium]